MTYITVKVPTDYQGRIVLEIKPKTKIPVSISLKPNVSDNDSVSSTSTTPSPVPNWKTQPRDAQGRFIKRS